MKHEADVLEKAIKVFEPRGIAGQETTMISIYGDAAQLYATIGSIPAKPGSDAARLVAVAKTHLETSAMFAVKALSRLKDGVNV